MLAQHAGVLRTRTLLSMDINLLRSSLSSEKKHIVWTVLNVPCLRNVQTFLGACFPSALIQNKEGPQVLKCPSYRRAGCDLGLRASRRKLENWMLSFFIFCAIEPVFLLHTEQKCPVPGKIGQTVTPKVHASAAKKKNTISFQFWPPQASESKNYVSAFHFWTPWNNVVK